MEKYDSWLPLRILISDTIIGKELIKIGVIRTSFNVNSVLIKFIKIGTLYVPASIVTEE